MPPTIRLTERRTREVRLPTGDVAFLVAHARHVVEVVPAFRRGVYRLTPRGYVGWFDTPSRRVVVRPKIPWPTVRMLLGLGCHQGVADVEPDGGLLNAVAREFAERLREAVRGGLVAGYHDRDTTSAFLRGKLRPADQLRDTAARAFPDRFHVTESVLDLDTPWNRVVRSVADELLGCPDLAPAVRADVRDASLSLEGVSSGPITDADFAAADAEPRAAHYRPLLAVCRLLHDGFAAAQLPGTGTGAFLIDLSRAFERYLTDTLVAAFAGRSEWAVEAQPRFPVGPTDLRPDILIRRRDEPRAVLDAKWKAPGAAPDAADLQQVLAYAAVTGAKHLGLVYPGRRFARRTFPVPGCDIRVSLFRVRLVGTADECARSVARFASVVRRCGR